MLIGKNIFFLVVIVIVVCISAFLFGLYRLYLYRQVRPKERIKRGQKSLLILPSVTFFEAKPQRIKRNPPSPSFRMSRRILFFRWGFRAVARVNESEHPVHS